MRIKFKMGSMVIATMMCVSSPVLAEKTRIEKIKECALAPVNCLKESWGSLIAATAIGWVVKRIIERGAPAAPVVSVSNPEVADQSQPQNVGKPEGQSLPPGDQNPEPEPSTQPPSDLETEVQNLRNPPQSMFLTSGVNPNGKNEADLDLARVVQLSFDDVNRAPAATETAEQPEPLVERTDSEAAKMVRIASGVLAEAKVANGTAPQPVPRDQ